VDELEDSAKKLGQKVSGNVDEDECECGKMARVHA
jgi:hypothetical protein